MPRSTFPTVISAESLTAMAACLSKNNVVEAVLVTAGPRLRARRAKAPPDQKEVSKTIPPRSRTNATATSLAQSPYAWGHRHLRPPELDQLGVYAALAAHARSVTEQTAMEVSLIGDIPEPRLSADALLELFRIVEELIANAAQGWRDEPLEKWEGTPTTLTLYERAWLRRWAP